MHAPRKRILRRAAALALVAALAAVVPTIASSQEGGDPPAAPPEVGAQAIPTVPVTGSIELCAKPGEVTMPDATIVPIWGFAEKPAGFDCADVDATLPGPTLDVAAGATVTVTVHNALGVPGENVSLVFPGQSLVPDPTGAAPGASVSYTFTASAPGTFLYEAGTDAARQVAMGLYGALIVRPAVAGQAYDGAGSAYDVEALALLSELDPALAADPMAFELTDYSPRYWLINGKAYPETETVEAAAGERVLLRQLNAGLLNHTMALLGAHEQVIAKDADPLAFPFEAVSETIPSGATMDAIVTVPAGALAGDKLPFYSRSHHLLNNTEYPGGMLTFLEVP